MKQITLAQLLKLFDAEVRPRIQAIAARTDASHLVVFENGQFDSSQAGARTAMLIGPGCTHKTLDAVRGQHLHDLPSQRQYPVSYVVLPTALTLAEARSTYAAFTATAVDDNGRTVDAFQQFPAGTHREEVWRYLENACPAFSVAEAMLPAEPG